MNRGDWIQLSFLIIIFLVVAIIIYSFLYFPFWTGFIELLVALILGWLISRRIKL